jgi:hypothetical protein
MMERPKCENCIFYDKLEGKIGKCKRYPPTLYYDGEENSTLALSPVIESDDWCGEFKSVLTRTFP